MRSRVRARAGAVGRPWDEVVSPFRALGFLGFVFFGYSSGYFGLVKIKAGTTGPILITPPNT